MASVCRVGGCDTPIFTNEKMGICSKHREEGKAAAARINKIIEVAEPVAKQEKWSAQEVFDAMIGALAAQLANVSETRDTLELNLDNMSLKFRRSAREFFGNRDQGRRPPQPMRWPS